MKTILQFMKPYKCLCFFTLLVMVLDVAGGLLIPTITADMINVGVSGGDMQYLLRNGAYMLVITLITSLGALTGSYLSADLSAKIGRDMRNALYDKSLTFSAYDFEQFGTGSMITRTLNDVNIIQQGVVWFIQMVLPVPAVCLMGIVMAFSIDTMMGFLLIGATVFVILLAVLVTRKASAIFDRLQGFLDRMNIVLRENVTGVRVIRAFNKEAFEEKRMKKSFEDYAESAIQANRLFAGLESAALFAINLCIVFILWLGGNRIGAGFMNIGDIAALTQYAVMILFYIIMAQMVFILIPRAMICVRRISAVLHHTPEIEDSPTAACAGGTGMDEVIRFDHASFRFADADEDTLWNLNFVCKRGETTAIIGSTGSGKSTIAKLILRFHDVTSGSILFSGCDVRGMTQAELRERIAYVPQKAWLFSGTIADNLRYGDRDADKKQMEHALRTAQAGFVNSLPDSLYAPVAQGGANFSGGQKQRLSIARALMKRADLYIFDDSFSALDFKTDAALRKALKNETAGAAVLIIAQRISTIMNAEQIIVLEDGRVAGIGSHAVLMESCPVYRDIAKSQMKGGACDE
ncbi:ABC transporter ATP-binding protein [Anaerotruncus colihominis]|uniref:ABC transporter ATP-binding protein n=1 Tax=Anaerotruncus colihominis TaxID=169435 RepID=UPI0026EB8BBB|nr:ABC transporter ATP-binding protein [Anaerotruncus colihominis]